jgi:hypothetical protein
MDATHLRHQAAELRGLAGEARRAAAMSAATQDVEWRSLAAERFREALRHEADLTLRCADLLDDAAQAMAAHARAVDGPAPAQEDPGTAAARTARAGRTIPAQASR